MNIQQVMNQFVSFTRKLVKSKLFLYAVLLIISGAMAIVLSNTFRHMGRMEITFYTTGNFKFYKLLKTENIFRDILNYPITDRWTLYLTAKPLLEYPENEIVNDSTTHPRPNDCILKFKRDTFDESARLYRATYTLSIDSLRDSDIRNALNVGINYTEQFLKDVPQAKASVNDNTIIISGIRSKDQAYSILTISRPVRWDATSKIYIGFGPYKFEGKIVYGVNTINLAKSFNVFTNESFPPELKINISPYWRKNIRFRKGALIIIPGFPPSKIPAKYKVFQLHYGGYTYIAIVLSNRRREIYRTLVGYTLNYLRANSNYPQNHLEPYWIPRGWLILGRATDIRIGLRQQSNAFPVNNILSLSLPIRDARITIGIYTSNGPRVMGINFRKFKTSFFPDSLLPENIKIIGVNEQNLIRVIREKKIDVLIYKSSFDPGLDSPGLLYEFAKKFAGALTFDFSRFEEFNRKVISEGYSARDVVTSAEEIQGQLRESMCMFPLFSEPVTILVDTTKVTNLHINYREGFANLNSWKWR